MLKKLVHDSAPVPVAPAERQVDHKLGCEVCLNLAFGVASFKLTLH